LLEDRRRLVRKQLTAKCIKGAKKFKRPLPGIGPRGSATNLIGKYIGIHKNAFPHLFTHRQQNKVCGSWDFWRGHSGLSECGAYLVADCIDWSTRILRALIYLWQSTWLMARF
jgi:hypothetical protein